MSKKLTGNVVLSTVGASLPPRIILDRKSLTIKTGIANSQTLPYSSINDVRLKSGLTSLNSELYIIPNRGEEIKLFGFSRSDYKLIKQAVSDGYFEDSSEYDDTEEEMPIQNQPSNSPKQVNDEQAINNGFDQVMSENEKDIKKIIDMEIDPSDEKALVKNLNALVDIIEIKSNKKVVKTALAKFENNLKILQLTYPENKLIPFFTSKPIEWKEAKQKKRKKKLIKWAIFLGVILLFFLWLLSQL